jgi:glutathione S-transferase
VTLLNWAVFLKADLAKWPALQTYHRRHLQRPSVVRAMSVEMEERKRRAA